jgi:hypothetical protein
MQTAAAATVAVQTDIVGSGMADGAVVVNFIFDVRTGAAFAGDRGLRVELVVVRGTG